MPAWRRWLPISAVGGVAAALLTATELGFALEETAGLRTLFQIRGAIDPPEDVVVLRLDNDSLSILRALPETSSEWPAPLAGCARRHPELVAEILQLGGVERVPRRLQACVVDLAREAGASTIVFDVAFPARADRDPGTRELAAAIARHGGVVVREATERRSDGSTQLDIITNVHPDLAQAAAGIATSQLPKPTERINQFWVRHATLPAPVQLAGRAIEVAARDSLERLATLRGEAPPADLTPDQRRQWLVAGALRALDADALPDALAAADRSALEAVRRVHRGPPHLYFNFYGPPGTVRSLSLWQLLGAPVPVDLDGATLFVGASSPTSIGGLPDTFATVMTTAEGVEMSGVELWATAFANLRDDTALRALPEWRRIGAMLVVGLLLMIVAQAARVERSLSATCAIAIAWTMLAIGMFLTGRLWLPFVGLIVLLPAALLVAALLRFRRARHSAASYMPKRVAERVFDESLIPTTWLDATVLLTDVVGFSERARRLERQGPDALRNFQDRHIAQLTAIVAAGGGEVMEQTGDGVLAMWSGPNHARRACEAALGIAAAIERRNGHLDRADEPLRLRIGINTGPITVGEVGNDDRRFLTCSGDTVNMTQRLEALGKTLCPDHPAVAIMLGAGVVESVGEGLHTQLVGQAILSGRTQPEPVYRLLAAPPVAAPHPATAAVAVAVALLLLVPRPVVAQPACEAPVARLVATVGSVSVAGQPVVAGSGGVPVCGDALIAVGPESRATLLHLSGDAILQLNASSRVRVTLPEAERDVVELIRGALFFISQVRRTLTIRTPSADAGIEGTEVLIAVGAPSEPALDLRVYEGRVALRPGAAPADTALPDEPLLAGDRLLVGATGEVQVARGEVASLRLAAGRELAWTLYYPPLFADPAATTPPLAAASQALAAGRVEAARAALAGIADGSADAAGRDALLALAAVSQGDALSGLTLAEAAAARQPTAATLLARSYAEQALRRLEDARNSARQATAIEPGNALAWARLAELELAFGDSRAARAAAERAMSAGDTALVHVVQGFTRLASFDAAGAEASFAAALDADSNQPLAHLGRGLAHIRRNDLLEGRRSLEAAAGLDPPRSLLRSYLGRAYAEERRDQDAADQFRIARQLDPDDPTPWLFDAIRKQLGNRPVEARRDLEQSIALSATRGTTRSGLLLAEDEAVRNVSLGRIYEDLGFEELGRVQATRSLALAPSSPAAHRFLSDVYRGEPRLEVARVSELLQAQLLQPLGQNPIQPSLGFTDLNLVAAQGPLRVSFDEFSPLFVRNGARLDATGLLGTDDTYGDEIAGTVLAGRFAASVGQYHYQTDGFRDNNDLEHDIVELFGQAQLTPELGVQAGYRWRRTDQGDRTLNYDPDAFQPALREGIDQDLWRLGATWRPRPETTIIASLLHAKDDETEDNALRLEPFELFPGVLETPANALSIEESGDRTQLELQGIFGAARRNLVLGGGVYDTDLRRTVRSETSFEILPDPLPVTTREHFRQEAVNLYAYQNLEWPGDVTWTFGAAIDRVELDDDDELELSPKLGVEWRPTSWLTLRGAAFRAVARPLVADQTIEPTQIAGLSQLYDDFPGTRSDQIALGFELQPVDNVSVVGWAAWRDLSVPRSDDDGVSYADENERVLGGAVYWSITDQLVLAAGVKATEFEQTESDAEGFPTRLTTVEAPLSLRWFSPSGWLAGASVTWFDQAVVESQPERHRSNSAPIVDAFVGYRLPRRLGVASLEVQNLLNEEFSFQDESFRTAELPNPWRLPTRSVMARLTLSF